MTGTAPVFGVEHYTPILELPELTFVAMSDTRRAWGGPLAAHRHHAMEINYLHHGSLRWWASNEWFDVRGGDVYVTWPDEPHGGGTHLIEPCTLYWLQVVIEPGGRLDSRTLLDLPAQEAAALAGRLGTLPRRHFRAGCGLHHSFSRLLACLDRQRDEVATTEVRVLLLQILVDVVRASTAPATLGHSTMVREALRYMALHPDRRVPLDDVAAKLGWSLPHLKRRFRAEVGMSPARYHTLHRVRLACERLASSDDSVTHIAVTMGFGSVQYFATTFKRWMGVTPHQYRSQAAGGSSGRRPQGG